MTGRQRILVIDDDPAIAATVSELLQLEGYTVSVSPDSNIAALLLMAEKPDLILLDLWMPGIDGWLFLTLLKHSAHRAIPVIVLSALTGFADRARAEGAVAFVGKPYDDEELLRVIARHLPRSRTVGQPLGRT